MRYTRNQAFALAQAIKQACCTTPNPPKIYVFGSVLKKDGGNDVDLLAEVSESQFQNFRQQCYTSGINYIIRGKADPQDLFWCYFSLFAIRARSAFSVLGISDAHAEILKTDGLNLQKNELDIICLPTGWTTSSRMKEFQTEMSAHWKCDPKFMQNLRDTAVLVE